jgi:hypothetical protein
MKDEIKDENNWSPNHIFGDDYHVLGDDYYHGSNGSKKDDQKAFENWLKGANLGSNQCMKNLAWAYENGIGCQPNPKEASYWMEHSRGFYSLNCNHTTDYSLMDWTSRNLSGSVVDLGCGDGAYVRYLRSKGFDAEGYDGNWHTPEISGGLCKTLDLSRKASIREFDWVISLEVGEHIPKEYEDVFIDNITKPSRKGLLLSWAVLGQKGIGHVNCKSAEDFRAIICERGFYVDEFATAEAKDACLLLRIRAMRNL